MTKGVVVPDAEGVVPLVVSVALEWTGVNPSLGGMSTRTPVVYRIIFRVAPTINKLAENANKKIQ
jgi:hypothetical protein